MHLLAAEATPSALGIGAYLALFVAAAAGYMGVPAIGTAVIGFAAVLASQGQAQYFWRCSRWRRLAARPAGSAGMASVTTGGALFQHPGPGLA